MILSYLCSQADFREIDTDGDGASTTRRAALCGGGEGEDAARGPWYLYIVLLNAVL